MTSSDWKDVIELVVAAATVCFFFWLMERKPK